MASAKDATSSRAARFPLTVVSVTVNAPEKIFPMPPPTSFDVLLLIVLPATVSEPSLPMPPAPQFNGGGRGVAAHRGIRDDRSPRITDVTARESGIVCDGAAVDRGVPELILDSTTVPSRGVAAHVATHEHRIAAQGARGV